MAREGRFDVRGDMAAAMSYSEEPGAREWASGSRLSRCWEMGLSTRGSLLTGSEERREREDGKKQTKEIQKVPEQAPAYQVGRVGRGYTNPQQRSEKRGRGSTVQ